MFKLECYTPDPVSCPSSCLRLPSVLGPVPPILYFTYQVAVAGALLGRFVRALRWVQGTTIIILRVLWGLMKVVAG